jgi:hypothetical protein
MRGYLPMIKKVWESIKVIISRLAGLLRFTRRAEPNPVPRVDLDQKLGREIQKRQAKGKTIDTHQGGPNMPRYQPCPSCGKGSKRIRKTEEGANYQCPIHGTFFVRAKGG